MEREDINDIWEEMFGEDWEEVQEEDRRATAEKLLRKE